MNSKEILCENIVNRRKNLGMTQAALAEKLNISPEGLTRIEKGHATPRLSRLDSIAKNLQCRVSDLFRPYKLENADRTAIINEALADLPEDAQEAIVNLVVQASKAIKNRYEK